MIREQAQEKSAKAFTKQQLMKSERYTKIQKDVLSTLLKAEEKYTLQQVDQLIKKIKQQEVR